MKIKNYKQKHCSSFKVEALLEFKLILFRQFIGYYYM